MPRPDEGVIHAWLDGELDATEATRVEAMVASDPGWAAAAAEARGLIAASARIAGALDRVPANVIPIAAPRPGSRRWAWRAAAAVVLLAGSAVVLERETPELPVRASPAPSAAAPRAAEKSGPQTKELDTKKRADRVRANDAVSARAGGRAEVRAGVRTGVAGGAPPAPPRQAPALAASPRALAAKAAPAEVRCFEQREPPDSAKRIITLDVGALGDSVRLGTLTIRGDTIAAVSGRLTAVRVQCPER